MPQLRDRVNFTIDREVRSRLETRVPKSKRSAFVETAIEKALEDAARQGFLDYLETMPRYKSKDGMGSVELVRLIRKNVMDDSLNGLSSSDQS